MILLLASEYDRHAPLVEDVLRRREQSFVRYDYSKFPAKSQLGIRINHTRQVSSALTLGSTTYSLTDFSAVWFRRPKHPKAATTTDKAFAKYIESESWAFLEGLLYVTQRAFWLSNPKNEQAAEYKHRQLLVAHELGLIVPDTVVGNHYDYAKQCIEEHGELAIKPFARNAMELELTLPQRVMKLLYDWSCPRKQPFRSVITVLTQRFQQQDAQPYLDMIPKCPVILQEYIPKKLELRITVVGKNVFPCAIYSQDSDSKNCTDWRNDPYSYRHEPWILPAAIEEKCLALVNRLGLHFGCIDMIVTPEDKYVFLEINPNGQWRWIQELTGMPIADAIADLLINGKES